MTTTDANDKPMDNLLVHMVLTLGREVNTLGKSEDRNEHGTPQFPRTSDLNQIERRSVVKSVFSYVEAVAYALKQEVLEADADIEPEELPFISEKEYYLDASGRIASRKMKLSFKSNTIFAFSLYARKHGVPDTLDRDAPGWSLLCSSCDVRDRLMHPKTAGDLIVSDQEIAQCLRAYQWFDDAVFALVQSYTARVEEAAKEAERRLAERKRLLAAVVDSSSGDPRLVKFTKFMGADEGD